MALSRDETGVEERILAFTCGIGCDAVIIAAATDSVDPINFAGAIARKRGTLVVVGAVRDGGAAPIPFEEIYAVTLTTFKIVESLRKRQAVNFN